MNDLTYLVTKWLENQKDFNSFFISKSNHVGFWRYDQIMYMHRLKCEVITDVYTCSTKKMPACDLYLVGFIESTFIDPWCDGLHRIKAQDPKFLMKLRKFLNHIRNSPKKFYHIGRFYKNFKDIKKDYYNGRWH